MKRREFITLLGGGAAAWPLAARAQQPAMPVIGVLGIFTLDAQSAPLVGLRKALREAGFVEDRDVAIETRQVSDGQYDRLLSLASELVRRPAAVLFATGSAGVARAAKAATSTTPIVFANGSDPVRVGLVASMNRPGSNATGVTFFTSSLGPKRLELLREIVPQASTVAFLVNPSNPVTEGDIADMENAARTIGQWIVVVKAGSENEIDTAFATMAREQTGALIVNVDAFFNSRRRQFAALAVRYRIPASYNNGQYVRDGGLMSYGDDRMDSYRQAGTYVARILKGEKPADLPVMQPTKFELVINLKTAKALGLEVPPTLLARADEVLE
jgi:putative tryptophan/tyrosine transport system substrate-binding protein